MGYKVLLADDSITIQKVIGIIFANEDYDLTVVDNGDSALEKAKEIQPDVILVDALMPGKSGYDVCREVRLDSTLKDVPLLLLVGAFEPFDEEKARNSGADDHISKPFESQFLIEKVKKLIELGEERARISIRSGTSVPVAAPVGLSGLGGEAVQAMEARPGISAAVADGVNVGGKPSSDVLYFDSLEMVEATPGDDLWGVFEIEEVAEGEDVQLGEIIDEEELQPEVIDTVEEIEPFVFREDEPVSSGFENTISLGDYPQSAVENESEADETFVLKEEPEPADFGEGAIAEVLAEASAGCIHDFGTATSHETPFTRVNQDILYATREEYDTIAEISAGQLESRTAGVSEIAGTGIINLSDEQLAGILSKVSREVIEKIVWEVVPDLAETIIREEIRKIKEGY